MSQIDKESTAYPGQLCQAGIVLTFEKADAASDLLIELGALAVSLEDAQADTEEEQPLFGEPGLEPESPAWTLNRVVALFRNETEARQVLAELPTELQSDEDPVFESIPEQDWVRLTQSQFDPIHITDTLWIVPSWHSVEADPNRVTLTLDPGLAFGTGSHPTTSLCLGWLCANSPAGLSVLDYGCGSGILGIAALKLGAREAIGIDIDPQAVISTHANATINGVEMPVGQPDFAQAKRQFPLVMANILSNPLKVLAPTLCEHVEADGQLVLSGVLSRQAEEVMQCYRAWMDMTVWQERDGWVCLAGKKRPASPHTA